MSPNDDPEFTFSDDGRPPLRCFRCEGLLDYDEEGIPREEMAEIVTVTKSHAMVHAECLDDPSILA